MIDLIRVKVSFALEMYPEYEGLVRKKCSDVFTINLDITEEELRILLSNKEAFFRDDIEILLGENPKYSVHVSIHIVKQIFVQFRVFKTLAEQQLERAASSEARKVKKEESAEQRAEREKRRAAREEAKAYKEENKRRKELKKREALIALLKTTAKKLGVTVESSKSGDVGRIWDIATELSRG